MTRLNGVGVAFVRRRAAVRRKRRLGLIASLAAVTVLLAGNSLPAHATDPQHDDRNPAIVAALAMLRYAQWESLANYLDVMLTPEFFSCICPVSHGYHFGPFPEGPCRRIGPLGGESYSSLSGDTEQLSGCLDMHAPEFLPTVMNSLPPPVPTTIGPPRSGVRPPHQTLSEWLHYMDLWCLPVPRHFDEMTVLPEGWVYARDWTDREAWAAWSQWTPGPILTQALRPEILHDAVDLAYPTIPEVPSSRCLRAVEVALFLEGQRGRFSADLALAAYAEFNLPDYWTGRQIAAEGVEYLASMPDASLSRHVGLMGNLADVADVSGMLLEELEVRGQSAHFQAALAAWRESLAWSPETLDSKIAELTQQSVQTSEQISRLRSELVERLRAAEPGAEQWSAIGPPVLPGTQVPSTHPQWQAYFTERDRLEREYRARIAVLVYDMTGLDLQRSILSEIRRPLNTMTCEELVRRRCERSRGPLPEEFSQDFNTPLPPR